jgi:hypothetical protein
MSTQNSHNKFGMELTIVVAVVGGRRLVRRCLTTLCQQLDFNEGEIIVPYDNWTEDVGTLRGEFPLVKFHFITDVGFTPPSIVEHQLYDRRRAVGISLARGRIVALTEDYAVPASDWCRQILIAHEMPYAAIGGTIDNLVDLPLNWALYYCDFGRYGSPLMKGEVDYASDVNIAYKYEELLRIRDLWSSAYHETTVNWALRSSGKSVFLDPRMIVFEQRPPITLRQALRERIEWGSVFAETRAASCDWWRRLLYSLGTSILPVVLLVRILKHMLRQRRTAKQICFTLPLAVCLVSAWAVGELSGYLRKHEEHVPLPVTIPET